MTDMEALLKRLNAISADTMVERLGITITAVDDDGVTGTMPVDARTHQPFGLLHGGASAALIETLGSVGSMLRVDPEKQQAVGIELNVTHMRAVRDGEVTCVAKVVRAGRRLHVWQADVTDEEGKPVATGRLTTMVIERG